MLRNQSLTDGTLEEAVEALAKLAAWRRTTVPSLAEKQALASSDVLGAVGRFASTPGGAALLGGGLGAATGAAGTFMQNRSKPENERHSLLRGALSGGLAGAAIGGGGAAAVKGFQGLKHPESQPGPQGEISVPGMGGKLDASVLRKHPDLHRKLQELAEPSFGEHVTDAFTKGYEGLTNYLPISSKVLPAIGVYDYLTHTQNRFGGKMLGDKNWLHAPGTAATRLASKLRGITPRLASGLNAAGTKMRNADFGIGMIDPLNSNNPEHLRAGVRSVLSDPKKHPQFGGGRQELLKWLVDTPEGAKKLDEIGGKRRGGSVTRDVPTKVEIQPSPVDQTTTTEHLNKQTGQWETQRVRTTPVFPPKVPHDTTAPETIGREGFRYLKGHGAEAQLGMPGVKDNVAAHTGTPRVRRGMFGAAGNVPAKSVSRVLGRIAGYGLPLAAEFVYNAKKQEAARAVERQKIEEMLRQSGLLR